jgi:pimeloyl-ACP methyl ester carboxylesterase
MAEITAAPVVQGSPVAVRPGRRLSLVHRPGANPQGYTLFFVHGGGGNKDQWRALWRDPRLADYNLVAWDLLGHGESDRPRDTAAYAWDELVADLQAIVQRFATERNVFLAHSYGTALTLCALQSLLAAQEPPSIDGVLLLGTQLQMGKAGKLLSLPVWLLALIRPLLAKGFRQAAWHPDTDPALIAYEESLSNRNSLRVYKALLRQGRWLPETIGPLGVRLRILAGEADRLTPPAGGQALFERLQGEHFEVLQQAGHQLMLERPDAVLAHLLALLPESTDRVTAGHLEASVAAAQSVR